MPLVLAPHAARYLRERRNRGEISSDTVRNQRCHLRGLVESFGSRPLGRLSRLDLEAWQETIGHLAPASRRQQLSTVRCFCRWLIDHGVITVNPAVNLPPVRQPRTVPRALSKAAVAAILDTVPDDRARAVVWLMLGCGLRCCEVARLEVADYDPQVRTLLVVGKGGHQRMLPVPEQAACAIEKYLAEVGVVHGPLIRSHRRWEPAAGVAPDTISRLVAGWMVAAGVKVRNRDGVSAHAIRHTAASDVLETCGDVRLVQEMLGHSSLATTTVYLRRADLGRLRAAMAGRSYRT